MTSFSLVNKLKYDVMRPVQDMAAFFDFTVVQENGDSTLYLEILGRLLKATLEYAGQWYACDLAVEEDTSGEVGRCVKLAMLSCLSQATGKMPELPWGVLTGVRPDKLAHKLLDQGVAAAQLPAYLRRQYLLPLEQGELLTRIAVRQKELLPDCLRFIQAGIYIGIPYCPTRCNYCSFPAGIIPKDEESQQNFVKIIEQDLLDVVQLVSMHSGKMSPLAIYIGGGTPTSLSESSFRRLMNFLGGLNAEQALGPIQEFTVEAGRPDCFSEAKLRAMEENGVNRVSVNPQTFHDSTLQLIGRNHSVADFYNAYAMVRSSSIPVVNMDLIIGLPGESSRDIEYSLAQAAQLAPENLTIHTLTIKHGANLSQSELKLPAEEAAALVKQAGEIAQDLGLAPYYLYRQHYMLGHLANIGYAKPGAECLYNIQMMEERHPIIGVGPASASKNPLEDGHHLAKLNMPKNVQAYTNSFQQLLAKRREVFTK